MTKNSKKKITKKVCENGEVLTLDGDCVRLVHNKTTRDTRIVFKQNCGNDDAMELFGEIGYALAGKKGKINIDFEDE